MCAHDQKNDHAAEHDQGHGNQIDRPETVDVLAVGQRIHPPEMPGKAEDSERVGKHREMEWQHRASRLQDSVEVLLREIADTIGHRLLRWRSMSGLQAIPQYSVNRSRLGEQNDFDTKPMQTVQKNVTFLLRAPCNDAAAHKHRPCFFMAENLIGSFS